MNSEHETDLGLRAKLNRLLIFPAASRTWSDVEEGARKRGWTPEKRRPLTVAVVEQVADQEHVVAPKASALRRRSGLRVALYASLAVVIVAAVAVGSLEAVKYLGKDQPILFITDEKTVTTEATTTTTQATTTTAPTDTGAAMFGGNAARTGVYPDGGPTDQPDLLWKFKTGDWEDTGDWEGTSPVVSDGVVYVGGGDDSYLYALDARSGEEKWKSAWYFLGVPAVSEGVVYIGGSSEDIDATGSNGGYLYALDAETGQERWKFRTPFGVTPSPAVSDGLVYFGTDGGYLYALDAASGQLKWDFLAMGRGEGPAAVSSPAVSDGVVYFSDNDGYLYALDAQTGQEKWAVDSGHWFESRFSPAVSDGVVYFAFGRYLHALDAQTGEEKWLYEATRTREITSSLAVSGGVVYFRYEAYGRRPEENEANALLVALDATSGRELWQFWAVNSACSWCYGACSSSPSISGETVYFGTSLLLHIGDVGRLHALDALTGEELWTWGISGTWSSSPAISDGVVYYSGTDGYLYALK